MTLLLELDRRFQAVRALQAEAQAGPEALAESLAAVVAAALRRPTDNQAVAET